MSRYRQKKKLNNNITINLNNPPKPVIAVFTAF